MTSSDGRAGGPGQPRRGDHLDDETLRRLVDGDLDGRARAAAEGHLGSCADCRRDLDALLATVAMLRALPEARPRRSLQLGPEHARRPSAWRRFADALVPAVPALRAAALAVVLVLGGITAAQVLRDDASDSVGNRAEATVASSGAVAAPTTLPTLPPDRALQRAPETATAPPEPPTVAADTIAETPVPTRTNAATRSGTFTPTQGAVPGDAPLPAPATGTKAADGVGAGEQAPDAEGPDLTPTLPVSAGGAEISQSTEEPSEPSAGGESSTVEETTVAARRSGDAEPTDVPPPNAAASDSAIEADDHTAEASDAASGDAASGDAASGDDTPDDAARSEETSDAASGSDEPAMASSAPEPSPTATATPLPVALAATPPASPVASPVASPFASPVASPRSDKRPRPTPLDDVASDDGSETWRRLGFAALLVVVGTVIVAGRIGGRSGR